MTFEACMEPLRARIIHLSNRPSTMETIQIIFKQVLYERALTSFLVKFSRFIYSCFLICICLTILHTKETVSFYRSPFTYYKLNHRMIGYAFPSLWESSHVLMLNGIQWEGTDNKLVWQSWKDGLVVQGGSKNWYTIAYRHHHWTNSSKKN